MPAFDSAGRFVARPPAERFWGYVSKGDDCWVWRHQVSTKGYGQFWDGKATVPAHRFSFALEHGRIRPGMFILHSCHNRLCVRPLHLREGTHQENMDDMKRAGRARTVRRGPQSAAKAFEPVPPGPRRGNNSGKTKLTEEWVYQARCRWFAGTATLRQLTEECGQKSIGGMHGLVTGRIWKCVPMPPA